MWWFLYRTLLDSVTDTGDPNWLNDAVQPPSIILKNKFKDYKCSLDPEAFVNVAKAVLLAPEDVKLWFDHLKAIDQKGAEKAAATRQ